jgi:uncharacterized protein YndB with AHSA1/START domain
VRKETRMAFVVRSEIEIEASREVVWRVLTDVASWTAWSTWLAWEGGAMTKGERVNLRLTPPDGGGYAFRPEVLVSDAPALGWGERESPGCSTVSTTSSSTRLPAGADFATPNATQASCRRSCSGSRR